MSATTYSSAYNELTIYMTLHNAFALSMACTRLSARVARRWSRCGTGRRTCSGAPSSTPGPSTCGAHALALLCSSPLLSH